MINELFQQQIDKRAVALEIANTIKRQLCVPGLQIIGSWGAHDFVALESGLQFKVSGRHFKGYVRILYNQGHDHYDISLVHMRQGRWQEKKCFTGIYCDQLTHVIDQEVEYVQHYRQA